MLWEGRFKSSLVQTERYFLECQRYIELNPVRAGMAEDPGDYMWSSYPCHGLGKQRELCSPHEEYFRLAKDTVERQRIYRELFSSYVEGEMLDDIRKALNRGLVLGNDRFVEEVETLYKYRARPGERGRPRIEA